MSRIMGLIGSVAINNTTSYERIGLNSIYMQCVRWKRKPMWMPPNKTKMFKMPVRVKHPEGEADELARLNNNYRTYNRSLKIFLTKYIEESQGEIIEDDHAMEDEDFEICSKINDEWNKNIAAQREIRLAKERQERREAILQQLIEQEQREKELEEKIKEQIEKLNKEASNFITEKNIDQVIEEVLANTVDYNAAIDVNGNFYKGSGPEVVMEGTEAKVETERETL